MNFKRKISRANKEPHCCGQKMIRKESYDTDDEPTVATATNHSGEVTEMVAGGSSRITAVRGGCESITIGITIQNN